MKNLKMLVAIIGMMALVFSNITFAQTPSGCTIESIPGCGCQTNGFSATSGLPCAGNVCTTSTVSRPSRLPVTSLEDLWIHAVRMVRMGNAQVNGSTILMDEFTRIWVPFDVTPSGRGDNLARISYLVRQATAAFDLNVSRVDLPLNFQLDLQDKPKRDVFTGGGQLTIVPTRNGYTFRAAQQIRVRIADVIAIPYEGADWVNFIERDARTNIIAYHQIPVVNGEILFPVGLISNYRELCHGDRDPDPKKYGEIKIGVYDPCGNYREDSFSVDKGGWYMSPKEVSGSALDTQVAGFIHWQQNVATVEYVVTEENAQFVGVLDYTRPTSVTIYPSKGLDATTGTVLTTATNGKLTRASDGFVVSEFVTLDHLPVVLNLGDEVYYLTLNDWESKTFGMYYREYHHIPRPRPVTPSIVDE